MCQDVMQVTDCHKNTDEQNNRNNTYRATNVGIFISNRGKIVESPSPDYDHPVLRPNPVQSDWFRRVTLGRPTSSLSGVMERLFRRCHGDLTR